MTKILVLHGPNLNMLGKREPEVYGSDSLADINKMLDLKAQGLDLELESFQSNAEHELVERVQETLDDGTRFIIINPGAFTHTSIALRDAFLSVQKPFIEVHLSNVHKREDFRQKSYLADVAVGVITGLGKQGYVLALEAANEYLQQERGK